MASSVLPPHAVPRPDGLRSAAPACNRCQAIVITRRTFKGQDIKGIGDFANCTELGIDPATMLLCHPSAGKRDVDPL